MNNLSTLRRISSTLVLSYKNMFSKNIEAEIFEILRIF